LWLLSCQMRSDAAELRASHAAEQRRLEAEALEREQSLNTACGTAPERSLNTARAKPQGQVTRAQAQASPQAGRNRQHRH
jgi:hypothetical protein